METSGRMGSLLVSWAVPLPAALVLVVVSWSEARGAAPAATNVPENPVAKCPHLKLANAKLKLTVATPDAESGLYRGSRFDWSGLVVAAEHDGHSFFAPWKLKHDPRSHEGIWGTAEEFSMDDPPGFDEVAACGVFYKIGIGELEKKETTQKSEQTGRAEPMPYGFWRNHRIVRAGAWTVTRGDGWVQFVQAFTGKRGWGWQYTKRIELAAGAAGFTIRRTLKNTGTKKIDTTHYCHNFTIIDGQTVGPAYRIGLSFDARPAEQKGAPAKVGGRRIAVLEELTRGKTVWMSLAGLTGRPTDGHVVIENVKTGAAMEISGGSRLAELRFWAHGRAACPEPFVAVRLAPGESMRWHNTYTFRVNREKTRS